VIQPLCEVFRRLKEVLQVLEPLAERGKVKGFLHNVEDAGTLSSLVEEIRDAMMDYQVRTRVCLTEPF
jgi:hypothetical protein